MAQIKIDLSTKLTDGMTVKFKAPCDCTAVTGLVVYYVADDGSGNSKAFSFRDSHGADLAGLGNLFSAGAYVVAVLDTGNGHAYLQNAATNSYIESKTKGVTVEIPAAAWSGNSCTVVVNGMTEDSLVTVTPHPDSFMPWVESMIRATAQGTGTLTFVCEDVPSETIKANLLIVG